AKFQQYRGEGKGAEERERAAAAAVPADAKRAATRGFMNDEMDLKKGVANAAAAMELGDFFQYLIEQPVTLPRQKSAMLPIVTQEVDSTKVSIYNQATHAKFPLLGLKFKNTTNLHLMQGPITVFEGSSYAGDARIMDLQPKEERLISYAIDLGTEVEPIVADPNDTITRIKIVKGILESTHMVRQSKTYNVKNRSEQDRVLLIEHPFRHELKLIAPKEPAERARDVYRFEVKVKAHGTAKQEVVEEQQFLRTVAITNFDDETIKFFFSQKVISDKVKKAVQDATALRSKV